MNKNKAHSRNRSWATGMRSRRIIGTDKARYKGLGAIEQHNSVDARKILSRHLSFEPSDKNIGLQLADIIVNATRRALNDSLKKEGWGNIGRLMVNPQKGENALQMVALHKNKPLTTMPYGRIVQYFNKTSKPMFVKDVVDKTHARVSGSDQSDPM